MSESVADSRGDYVVAYYSQVHEKDHKEHKIRLDSARKGVHLLTREAYFGDTVEPDPDALETAVFSVERRSPIDASEVGLRVDVAPNHITIHVDPADVLLGEDHHAHLGMMLAFYSGGFLKETSNVAHVEVDATKNEIVIPEDLPSKDKIQSIEKIRVMVFDRGLHSLGSVTIPVQ
jgi:hypothetical protein